MPPAARMRGGLAPPPSRSGQMERLRFLQRAHGEGLITTEEYQLHKQRVLHFCSARHGNTLSCMDSGCQFDGTASAVHNGQTVKSTASPHTASAARVEQLTPLVDALNRLASLLEAHLHALPPPDDGLSGPGNQPCNESDLSSTMIIIPTQQADSAQYERAVLESESSRSGIVSGSSRPLSSPAAAPDSTVGISTDSLDTAPTEKNNKRAGRRFAFDRHGKSAISSRSLRLSGCQSVRAAAARCVTNTVCSVKATGSRMLVCLCPSCVVA